MKRLLLIVAALLTILPAQVSALTAEQRRIFDSGAYYFDIDDSVCSNVGITNGSIDRFLQVLAYQESGGNPTAESGSSTASGKYQYLDSTWQARVSLYGPSGQYSRAKLAPEEVQDAVAYIEYTQKFRALNSDLFQLAVSHYLGHPTDNPAELDKVPGGGNSITPRQYANRLIQNMGTGLGSNIPLKYAQAPEFDIWLVKVGGTVAPVNAGGPESGCATSATGGTVVQIAQAELAAGANQADRTYLKYTSGIEEEWCADFVSWVFKQAGKPFDPDRISSASGIMAYAQAHGYYHPKGESGFTPQPGDVAIYKEGLDPFPSHVNIVISYDATTSKYTSIGGNENNKIMQSIWGGDLAALTGFMRVP